VFIDLVETGWPRERDSRIVSQAAFGEVTGRLWAHCAINRSRPWRWRHDAGRLDPPVLIAAALCLLEAACRLGYVSRDAVIPPTVMLQGTWRAMASEEIRADVLLTLQNVLLSLGLSLVAGTAGGLLLHRTPRLRRALDPLLASYYAVPTFVFYPLFIVLFGLNRWPLIAIGFLFAVVAVIINTLDGLARIPRAFVRTAAVMRLTPAQYAVHIILPARRRGCSPARSSRSPIRSSA
jgi:ABC-type nitrate/sulfonate/bicarbonate transport system permease component